MSRRRNKQEGPVTRFLMGQLAALFFSVPTAVFLWLFTNRELALWGNGNLFLNTLGFWMIVGFFVLISAIFPKLFPSILSKIWRGIIRFDQWF